MNVARWLRSPHMKKSFHIYRIELMSWNTYRRIFRRVGARAIHVLKITYVKKVEYISEFLFGICWWTWKANIYLKNCWSEPIKNKIILISTMLHLKIKNKKNTWRYHYFTPVQQKSWWYDLHFLRYRAWQNEIGSLWSFFALLPPKIPKNQNFEKMKNIAGHKIILQMSTINDNHMMYGSRDMERERQNFLSFWTIFYLLTPPPPPAPHLPPTNNPKNPKLKKKEKIAWRYYHFTHVY